MKITFAPIVAVAFFVLVSCSTVESIRENPDNPVTYAALSAGTQAALYAGIQKMDRTELEQGLAVVDTVAGLLSNPDNPGEVNWQAAQVYVNQQVPEAYRSLAVLVFGLLQGEITSYAKDHPEAIVADKLITAAAQGARQAFTLRLAEQ